MQIAIVTVTLPWIWVLHRTRFGAPLRQLGASGALLVAFGWLVQRSLGIAG